MESYRLPFCAVIALWLLTVQVIADQRPVLGQGNISCSLWLEGRQTDSPSAASRTGWVLGFMSAFNQFGTTSERTDVSEGKSTEELMAWIDGYCRQHQGDHLHMALQAFIDDFRKRISSWISEFTRTRTYKPAATNTDVDGAMLAASLGRRSEGIDGICNVPKVAGRTWVSLRYAVRKARRRSWDCDDPPCRADCGTAASRCEP